MCLIGEEDVRNIVVWEERGEVGRRVIILIFLGYVKIVDFYYKSNW